MFWPRWLMIASTATAVLPVWRSPMISSRCRAALSASAPAPHHTFHAVAFIENLPLKDLASVFENARRTPHELRYSLPDGRGRVFIYPFGAMVFHDVTPADREAELARL